MRRFAPNGLCLLLAFVACAPAKPDAEAPINNGQTKVTVTKGAYDENAGPEPARASADVSGAKPLDPPPTPKVSGASNPLIGGAGADAPLPLPTTLATTRYVTWAFARTRAGYVARIWNAKAKTPAWSAPVVVQAAFDDDAPPVAVGDGDSAWIAVAPNSGLGLRVSQIDVNGKVVHAAPRDDLKGPTPAKLGRPAAIVPLKNHLAVIGRDGDAIMFARLQRTGVFLDATAKKIANGTATASTTASRSPRAVLEDDKVLLAWDAHDLAGALESPGTTPAERVDPKSGIYVRRFDANGEPASPLRRLTRPGFEAHTLDVVVELGACAVLATTPDGYEMFRFVRKGDDLGPYGGGLHLAGAGGDVSLATDVYGTLAVTPTKLLRIGPGVKIVPSALPFSAPAGGTFEEIRVAPDGYGAHVVLGAKIPGGMGLLPTIARIDGSAMGPTLPVPWIGPPPQRLLTAAMDGDEGLAIVVESGALHAVRFASDGKTKGTTPIPFDVTAVEPLLWPRNPVPRAARAQGEWLVALADGRVLVATGPKAGTFVPIGKPKGLPIDGIVALMPNGGKEKLVRVLWIPAAEREGTLATATVDPITAKVPNAWLVLPGTDHHYGALGNARYSALPRKRGGLWLVTHSGPKVSLAAQLYELVAIDNEGAVADASLLAPGPMQEISLVPTTGGSALVATLTGKGVAARWLDAGGGWNEAFAFGPFRTRGDGPVIREKSGALTLGKLALPFDLGNDVSSLVGERCPIVLPTGERSLLLACEEGSGDTPLAARATLRTVGF